MIIINCSNKEVAFDGSDAVRGVSVLHTDGIPHRVIEVDKQMLNAALFPACLPWFPHNGQNTDRCEGESL